MGVHVESDARRHRRPDRPRLRTSPRPASGRHRRAARRVGESRATHRKETSSESRACRFRPQGRSARLPGRAARADADDRRPPRCLGLDGPEDRRGCGPQSSSTTRPHGNAAGLPGTQVRHRGLAGRGVRVRTNNHSSDRSTSRFAAPFRATTTASVIDGAPSGPVMTRPLPLWRCRIPGDLPDSALVRAVDAAHVSDPAGPRRGQFK